MPLGGATILTTDPDLGWICRATQSIAQSLFTSTMTAIQFNGTNDVDSLGIHDPVTNNTRFVIGLKLGWWHVSGNIAWSIPAAAARFAAQVTLNGTAVAGSEVDSHATTGGFFINTYTCATVNSTLATDYVEIQGLQATGGNLATSLGSNSFRSAVSLIYLGS